MISRLLGWGRWFVVDTEFVQGERRTWRDCDPYGYVNEQDYRWTGHKVTYKRVNSRTGKYQYKYEEFTKCIDR